MKRNSKILLGVALVAALVIVGAPRLVQKHATWNTDSKNALEVGTNDALAQSFSADKYGTGRVGITFPCFNTLDSTVLSGTLLMIDTTTTVKHMGVTPYDGTLSNRKRVCGWASGNLPKRSLGGAGAMIVWGFVPDIKMSASNTAAGAPLRVGTLHGSVKEAGDSLSMQVGYTIRGPSGTINNGRYTAWAWVWPVNHAVIGAL